MPNERDSASAFIRRAHDEIRSESHAVAVGRRDLAGVAREVADGGIELADADAHGAHYGPAAPACSQKLRGGGRFFPMKPCLIGDETGSNRKMIPVTS